MLITERVLNALIRGAVALLASELYTSMSENVEIGKI